MPPVFPNLISDSLLITSTIDYLVSVGGRASSADVIEYVMSIPSPDPNVADALARDLADRDPRLIHALGVLELDEPDLASRRLSDDTFVIFDLETTGAKGPPCRVIEIGAYRVRGGVIEDEFQTLVRPDGEIPAFITHLTGISDAMVADAPRFHEVLPDLLAFMGDAALVAHNAAFDIGFMNFEIARSYENYRLRNPNYCTVNLSRKLVPLVVNHKLKTLADHFSIELVDHHRAAPDARATAEIFIRLWNRLAELGVNNLAELTAFSNRKNHGKRNSAAA